MLLTAQKITAHQLSHGFRMCVMRLMPNQWDQKSLRLRQAGLEFVKVKAWNDSIFVALDQQDGGLDGR